MYTFVARYTQSSLVSRHLELPSKYISHQKGALIRAIPLHINIRMHVYKFVATKYIVTKRPQIQYQGVGMPSHHVNREYETHSSSTQ